MKGSTTGEISVHCVEYRLDRNHGHRLDNRYQLIAEMQSWWTGPWNTSEPRSSSTRSQPRPAICRGRPTGRSSLRRRRCRLASGDRRFAEGPHSCWLWPVAPLSYGRSADSLAPAGERCPCAQVSREWQSVTCSPRHRRPIIQGPVCPMSGISLAQHARLTNRRGMNPCRGRRRRLNPDLGLLQSTRSAC